MATQSEHKGFTIAEDFRNHPYSNKPEFIIYPTSEGIQHDYDYVGESYKYCGNCQWADSMEEAVEMIDDFLLVAESISDADHELYLLERKG